MTFNFYIRLNRNSVDSHREYPSVEIAFKMSTLFPKHMASLSSTLSHRSFCPYSAMQPNALRKFR